MPFFSVIIPTYNSALTLKAALESVINQAFPDYEVIIMDGLSTDDSLKIARSFNDQRIKIFSEKDSGVYDAMNKAVEKATGQWLYFLGSDDQLYDNTVFSGIYSVSQKENYNLIYGDAYFTSRKIIYGDQFDRLRLKTHNISHQAIFYKRYLFERLGKYNTQFKIWADWDFNIRCFSFPEIKPIHIKTTIVKYNDEGGLSAVYIKDAEFIKLLPSYVEEDVMIIRSAFIKKIRNMIPKSLIRQLKKVLTGGTSN